MPTNASNPPPTDTTWRGLPRPERSSHQTLFDTPGFFPFIIINLFALIILISTSLLIFASPMRWPAMILGVGTLLWCIVPWVWYRRLMRSARRRELNERGIPTCIRCGYDLAGLDLAPDHEPIPCPECGAMFDASKLGSGQ